MTKKEKKLEMMLKKIDSEKFWNKVIKKASKGINEYRRASAKSLENANQIFYKINEFWGILWG